jgi:uncharacterized protein (DUF2225 family)
MGTPPQNQANFLLEISERFSNIGDADNAQVTWLSNVAERNLDWNKWKYTWYNDFLTALDSFRRVTEMINQHHTALQRKTRATKTLGDL